MLFPSLTGSTLFQLSLALMAQSSENFTQWQPRDLVGLTALLEQQDQENIAVLEFHEARSASILESSETPDRYLLPVPDARSNSGSHMTEGFARRLEEDAEIYLPATDRNSVIAQVRTYYFLKIDHDANNLFRQMRSLPHPQTSGPEVLVSLPPEAAPSVVSAEDILTIISHSFMALLANMWSDLSFGFYRISVVYLNNSISTMVAAQIAGRTIAFDTQGYIISMVMERVRSIVHPDMTLMLTMVFSTTISEAN